MACEELVVVSCVRVTRVDTLVAVWLLTVMDMLVVVWLLAVLAVNVVLVRETVVLLVAVTAVVVVLEEGADVVAQARPAVLQHQTFFRSDQPTFQ